MRYCNEIRYFGHNWLRTPKMYYQLGKTLGLYLQAKNQLYPTCLFGHNGDIKLFILATMGMLGYKVDSTNFDVSRMLNRSGICMKYQYRSSHTEVFCKKVFKEISQNSQENTCARVSFFFINKETLAEVFSCEFCEISKNTFPYRTPLVAASANSNTSFYLDYLQEKLMKTFFPKNPKNPIYLQFWGFFA